MSKHQITASRLTTWHASHILVDAVGRAFRYTLFFGQVCFALMLSLLVTIVLI